jgi:hypothetical protein
MHICKIVSYGGAWEKLKTAYVEQYEDICWAISQLTQENIANSKPRYHIGSKDGEISIFHLQACWDDVIQSRDWASPYLTQIPGLESRLNLTALGKVKNGISVSLQRHRELLNRWLYTLSPLAIRSGYIEIPVAVIMTADAERDSFGRRMNRADFERTIEELVALSPLSHSYPFVIIGMSLTSCEIEVIELVSESEIDDQSAQIVVNRSIEFPPQYHQAGLGVLTYFGTVLREKYPGHNAKVRIEQDGLIVRLIIETENGDREIIEKALQEYESVVRGEAKPDDFFESKLKVLELKSELRIAQVRIESQRDLIELQGQQISTLKDIIGHSLSSSRNQPFAITVNPYINVSSTNNNQVINQMPEISRELQDLIVLAADDAAMQMRLLDLDEAVTRSAVKTASEDVKVSSGLLKLRKFIEEAEQTGSSVNKFLGKLSDGVEIAQKIARKYNEIASWCGAPVVPSIFLKGKD